MVIRSTAPFSLGRFAMAAGPSRLPTNRQGAVELHTTGDDGREYRLVGQPHGCHYVANVAHRGRRFEVVLGT